MPAGAEIESLRANAGDAELILDGNELANSIHGGGGNDLLRGFDGGDILRGNDGTDRLIGGGGSDLLFGDAGVDTFVFGSAADAGSGALRDQIRDFEDGVDRIDLRGFSADFDFIGSAAFGGQAGELRAFQAGANTLVAGDLDGDQTADFEILLTGPHSLSGNDFLL
jgi:Ca2+-binding RTX toxin-like protein